MRLENDDILETIEDMIDAGKAFTSVELTNELRERFPDDDIPCSEVINWLREEIKPYGTYKIARVRVKGTNQKVNYYFIEGMDVPDEIDQVELINTWNRGPIYVSLGYYTQKRCNKCGRILDLSKFHVDARRLDKHRSNCKECRRNGAY